MIINKIKARIYRIYNRLRYPFIGITGMMGDEERLNLYKLAQDNLPESGIVVEFGAFFGASTGAIQAGLKKSNPAKEFYVIDSFQSRLSSSFSNEVRHHAKSKNLDTLLVENEEENSLDFYSCFLKGVGDHDNMIISRCLLSEFIAPEKPISFMHLDLPKEWSQLRLIIDSCFGNLELESKVLFQDFGYHWSAELIAAIGHMLKNGNIELINLVDTTLSVRVIKRFSNNDIQDLIHSMSEDKDILIGFNFAVDSSSYLFSPINKATLDLALTQFYYSIGRRSEAYKILSKTLSTYIDSPDYPFLILKVVELLTEEFKLDRSYE
jgi:hypothetical protein